MIKISTKDIKWVKHYIRIKLTDNIEIEKIDYYEEVPGLSCVTGAYYDLESGECLGTSVTRRKYLIYNNVDLNEPIILPKLGWKSPEEE